MLLVVSIVVHAQNADMSNEPTSGDLLLLQMLNGERSIGSASVLPPRLGELFFHPTALDTFCRYVRAYYAPLGDTTRLSWQMPSHLSGRRALATVRDSVIAVRVDASGYGRGGLLQWNASEMLATGRLSLRAIGQIASHWSFVLDLANGALFRGDPYRVAITDPDMARAQRLFLDQRSFYDRTIGALQHEGSLGRIRIGRDVVGWGYSPLGGLLLSVNQPLLDHLLVDVRYGSVRFSYLHGAAIGSDITGRDVPTKFVAAHRVQFDPADRVSVAISDAIVYSGRGLDISYLNPLGFYVSSGLTSTERNERDNSLLAVETAWRPLDGMLVYGTILADDISFSTLTDTSAHGNNNKYAWQIGLAQRLGSGATPVIVVGEYVRINPFVYSHRTIVNSWTSQGEILGALQQPNSDRWTLAGILWLAPRLRFAARFDYLRWGENWLDSAGRILTALVPGTAVAVPVGNVGGDATRGDGDALPEPFAVGNRFLRGNVSHTRHFQAWISLEPIVNVFVDIRAEYVLRTGGNMPLDRWWWWVQLRLGY
ncbi:MAG: hypothetical protein N2663_05750 [Chlorobi bacterium]|nr:hypothetical protein [Chlorobiota bacterium]